MAWKAFWALPWAAVLGCTWAASYDDYTRGLSALAAKRYDLAIQSFSTALAAGDLAATYIPVAHMRRAAAYMAAGDCKNAVSDLNAAAAVRTPDSELLTLRLWGNLCAGDKVAADRDFTALLSTRPEKLQGGLFTSYARALWDYGDFAAAGEKYALALQHTDKKNTHSLYLDLWYAMSTLRAGRFDTADFDKRTADIPSGWPAPIVAFYRGQTTVEQLYHAAQDSDAVLAAGQKCEADFYLGEWHLSHGDQAVAAPLIHQAAENCPHRFVEYDMAQTEEHRLKK